MSSAIDPGGRPLGVREAYGALGDYARTYGELPLRLLLHAAVPQSFRADLLNLLKVNFVPEAGGDLSVDADVLLSPLVEATAAGYFRLDPEIRRQSLDLLDAVYRSDGSRRSVRVARFLIAWLDQLDQAGAAGMDPLLAEYAVIQRWVALALIDPPAIAAALARSLSDALAEDETAVRARLGGIAAALSIPLSGHQPLLFYAQGAEALRTGNADEARRLLEPLGEICIGDVTLRPGADLLDAYLPREHKQPSLGPGAGTEEPISTGGPGAILINVPSPPDLFIGRELEFEQARDALLQPLTVDEGSRWDSAKRDDVEDVNTKGSAAGPLIIALLGPEGIGKFTLARALVHDPQIRERYNDGIVWLGEDGSGYPQQWLNEYCDAAKLAAPLDEQDIVDTHKFSILFAGRRVLLIADHRSASDMLPILVEHAGDGCAVLLLIEHPPSSPPSRSAQVALDPLAPEASRRVLQRVSAPEDISSKLIGFAEGNPLLLRLAAVAAKVMPPEILNERIVSARLSGSVKESPVLQKVKVIMAALRNPYGSPSIEKAVLIFRLREFAEAVHAKPPGTIFAKAEFSNVGALDSLIELGLLEDLGKEVRLHSLLRATIDVKAEEPKGRSTPSEKSGLIALFISYNSKDKEWAAAVHAALIGHGYQPLFLDIHPDDGIHAGADWERMLYQRLRQSRGVIVLCSANWLASPWCVAEAMMARERKRRVFLLATADAAENIPDFLKDTQFISLARVSEEAAYQLLLQGLEKEGLKKYDFQLPHRPYLGLEPFQETDAAIFFGRDDESDQVIDLLHKCRKGDANGFILVLGASGCGKSSLVRAGVLPQLRRASGGGGEHAAWVIPPPFMGGKGLGGLAMSLAHAFKDAGQPRELATVRGRLATASDLRTLGSELLLAHGAPDGSVLLVLDQLEEVFGTPEVSEARAALGLLLDASADTSGLVVILATLRSDFLNAFQLFEGAAKRYEEVTLDPMLRSHFSEVIEGPADRFGLDLDAGLTERLVEDTGYGDALPLLAFTLERLYAKCAAEGRLSLQAYDELGGVSAVIKHAADGILADSGYTGLPADDAKLRDLRRAFFSLTRIGKDGQFAPRPARWSQMPASCANMLARFVENRLLVFGADNNGERTLSVAHEALFWVWDRLRGWLLQEREALILCAQIEDAAAEWDKKNRAEGWSWPNERILDAIRVIRLSSVSLNDVARPSIVRAFLGPTDVAELAELPALSAAEDEAVGSGRYGAAWRLPLSHEARASVGVRLALLGDSRRGVGLRADGLPDIDWRHIDGGEVTIEIRLTSDDPNSDVVKRLTRTVDPFSMARYPVTIAQFQAFLDECYRDGTWRLPAGFPVDLTTANWPSPKHRARHLNHPADSIAWVDAAAFCHWLSARLGFEVRLPKEAEWQRAATGGDPRRIYPWGSDWDPEQEPWRANTGESELGRSTAVGMYPAGASTAGVEDMAGTLWEWCQNAFDDPDNTGFREPTTEDRRVLHGGSWSFFRDFARSASRGLDYPYNRSYDVGFRVVCSSPSPGTDH